MKLPQSVERLMTADESNRMARHLVNRQLTSLFFVASIRNETAREAANPARVRRIAQI